MRLHISLASLLLSMFALNKCQDLTGILDGLPAPTPAQEQCIREQVISQGLSLVFTCNGVNLQNPDLESICRNTNCRNLVLSIANGCGYRLTSAVCTSTIAAPTTARPTMPTTARPTTVPTPARTTTVPTTARPTTVLATAVTVTVPTTVLTNQSRTTTATVDNTAEGNSLNNNGSIKVCNGVPVFILISALLSFLF